MAFDKKVSKMNRFITLVICLLMVPGCKRKDEDPVGTNRTYLNNIAAIVWRAAGVSGKVPASLEDALTVSGTVLSHRGDAYGHHLSYFRIDDRAFFLHSVGKNDKDEYGLGDDLQLCYLNGAEVAREKFIKYIKSNHPMEWDAYSGILPEPGFKE